MKIRSSFVSNSSSSSFLIEPLTDIGSYFLNSNTLFTRTVNNDHLLYELETLKEGIVELLKDIKGIKCDSFTFKDISSLNFSIKMRKERVYRLFKEPVMAPFEEDLSKEFRDLENTLTEGNLIYFKNIIRRTEESIKRIEKILEKVSIPDLNDTNFYTCTLDFIDDRKSSLEEVLSYLEKKGDLKVLKKHNS